MKRYDTYKPSGVDWIGEIPEHWAINKFKRISYMKGRIGWQGLKQSEFTMNEEQPYLITGMNFKDGVIRWEEVYHINEKRYDEAPEIQLKQFDVLMTKDGTIGKLLYIDSLPGKASLNSHLLVLRPLSKNYFPKYLYYQLQSLPFHHFIELNKTGTTFYGLSQEAMGNYKFISPLLKEQRTIADYLDKKTAEIDTIISKKQQLITLLKEERTAIINEALSGEGKNWERKKLKYVAKKVQTGSTPPSNESQYYFEELNWFTPSDFSGSLVLQNSKRKIAELAVSDGIVKMFPPNSVLFVGIGATLGKVGYILKSATSNQQINCLSFKTKEEAVFYANWFLVNQPDLAALSNTATLPILNQAQMKDILLPVPKTEEYKGIIDHIQNETQRIDITISKIEKEITLLQEYRTALISEVVTGKVKVA